MDQLTHFIISVADAGVQLIVIFGGIIISLIKFRSLGRAALFSVAGFLMLAIACLVDGGHFAWVTFGLGPDHSRETFETVYAAKTAAHLLFSIIGLTLLILAIVVKRPVPVR